jgi:hypothetical protein
MKSMNKIYSSLLTVFAFVSFIGCSEDNEVRTVATEADLAGTWTLQSANFDISVEGKSLKEYLVESGLTEEQAEAQVEEFQTAFEESDEFAEGALIEFKSDNEFLVKSPDTEDFESNGTWELSADGKKITIGEVDEMLTFDIRSITNKNLSLDLIMTEFDNMGGSASMNFEIKVLLDFKK